MAKSRENADPHRDALRAPDMVGALRPRDIDEILRVMRSLRDLEDHPALPPRHEELWAKAMEAARTHLMEYARMRASQVTGRPGGFVLPRPLSESERKTQKDAGQRRMHELAERKYIGLDKRYAAAKRAAADNLAKMRRKLDLLLTPLRPALVALSELGKAPRHIDAAYRLAACPDARTMYSTSPVPWCEGPLVDMLVQDLERIRAKLKFQARRERRVVSLPEQTDRGAGELEQARSVQGEPTKGGRAAGRKGQAKAKRGRKPMTPEYKRQCQQHAEEYRVFLGRYIPKERTKSGARKAFATSKGLGLRASNAMIRSGTPDKPRPRKRGQKRRG